MDIYTEITGIIEKVFSSAKETVVYKRKSKVYENKVYAKIGGLKLRHVLESIKRNPVDINLMPTITSSAILLGISMRELTVLDLKPVDVIPLYVSNKFLCKHAWIDGLCDVLNRVSLDYKVYLRETAGKVIPQSRSLRTLCYDRLHYKITNYRPKTRIGDARFTGTVSIVSKPSVTIVCFRGCCVECGEECEIRCSNLYNVVSAMAVVEATAKYYYDMIVQVYKLI